MTDGIKIRNPNTGILVFDSNTQLGRVIGQLNIKNGSSGSINVDGFSEGEPFYFSLMDGFGVNIFPVVSITGNTLNYSFSFQGESELSGVIIYGVC